MHQFMSRTDENVRRWALLPVVAAGFVMFWTAAAAPASIAPAAPAGDVRPAGSEINSWPTFDFPSAGSVDQSVIRARLPLPDGTGGEAPATVPLPPAVLTGGAILGMQWLAMRLTKNRKI